MHKFTIKSSRTANGHGIHRALEDLRDEITLDRAAWKQAEADLIAHTWGPVTDAHKDGQGYLGRWHSAVFGSLTMVVCFKDGWWFSNGPARRDDPDQIAALPREPS